MKTLQPGRSGRHRDDRPEKDRRSSNASSLRREIETLVDQTVERVLACPVKIEPTFDGFGELLSVMRSATTVEGLLIERAIGLAVRPCDDLVAVPLDRPLPILAAARAFLKRNAWTKAGSLRLDAEVHSTESYRPDHLLVDVRQHRALLLDVKRSVASYKPGHLSDLRERMMAAALVVRDVLEREHDVPPVERAEIAIIDASGDAVDHSAAIFGTADLDALLGIDGVTEAVETARQLFGARIRDIVLERCRAVVVMHDPNPNPGNGETSPRQIADDADANGGDGTKTAFLRQHRRVSVGIASIGGRA
jgi:hypothetical protein